MKLGAIIAVLIATLVAPTLSYADGVIIPMSTKVNLFKKLMKERGMDLSGEDDSDGHVQDYGNEIKVITNRPVTLEQLDKMKEAAYLAVRR